MLFKSSFQRMQSLRDEILEIGMYMVDLKRLPYKPTSRQFLDFLWNTRSMAYAQDGYSGIHEYLQSLYYEWECVRNSLAENLEPLVKKIARRYSHRNLDFNDLVQEGFKGALRALDCFDVDFGVPFEAFAVPWIRKYLSQLVNYNSEVVRLPESQVKIHRQRRDASSISSYVDFFEDPNHIMDESQNMEQQFVMSNTMEYVKYCVDALNYKQRNIIRTRYFGKTDKVLPLETVGKLCGCSRECSRQIEKGALQALEKKLKKF